MQIVKTLAGGIPTISLVIHLLVGASVATHVVPGSALIISWGIYGLILRAIIITKGLLRIAILYKSSPVAHRA